MKKLWLFILAGAFAVSCSDDNYTYSDDGSDGTSATLLRKTVETAADGTQVTTNYQYDGERLMNVTHSNGLSESYAYINMDYLSEIRHYDGGGLIQKEQFIYATGAFTDHITHYYVLDNPTDNYSLRSHYEANGNTVTVTEYTGDETNQTELVRTVTLSLTTNNNIVKFESDDETINYSFDYQNAPLKELPVYGLIILGDYIGGSNNITGIQTVSSSGAVETSLNTYTYGTDDYPVTKTHTAPDGSVSTTEYFY